MRNLLRSAISLLLVAVVFSLTLASSNPTVTTTAPAPCKTGDNQGRGKVQTLKGDAAKLRINQLVGKKKALKRALKDMEKLGKTPVWDDSAVFIQEPVEPSARVAQPHFGGNSFAPQEVQSFDDGAGSEMVLISESGPEEYWSGVVYVYDATTGLDSTYSAVITGLVLAELDTIDVVDELYYPPDGGLPIREEPPTPIDRGGDGGGGWESPMLTLPVSKIELKNSSTGTMTNASFKRGNATVAAPRPGILGWFKRYFRCIKRCQSLTALTCFNIFAMPRPGMPYPNYHGYFVCLSFGALASSIVCAFNTHACGG
jgi:hypothetical protein